MAAYTETFTTNAFTSDAASGKYKMWLSADTINLGGGMNIRLSKLLRLANGCYNNTIASYEVNTDGSMSIYSDEPFIGKLVVTNDE